MQREENLRIFDRGAAWAALIALTLLAAFLRFYRLGDESLWDGEIFTLLFAQYPWSLLLPSVAEFSAHPPLWFALSKLAIAFGWTEMLLRVPAAFAGILSVPALYVLGRRLFDRRVALVGAALLAISPIDVLFSQNARNYAFFVLLAILLLYGAIRAVDGPDAAPRARGWVLFVVAALAGLYTHYLFILPLAGAVLALALRLIQRATARAGGWARVRAWWGPALVSARSFLIALIAITALYLPWTPTVGSAFLGRQLTREAGHETEETVALTLDDAPRLLKDFSGDNGPGLVLMAALAVVGVAASTRPRRRAPLFWFGLSLVLPIAVMVLLAPRRLPAKYLIYVLPAYLLFVARGAVSVAAWASARLRVPRLAYVPTLVLLALLAFLTLPNLSYWNGRGAIFTGKGWAVVDDWRPWRAVAAMVTAGAAPGDLILFPEEARALTARSVMPYFDPAFLARIYNAPPSGRVWWVSEQLDVPPSNAAFVARERTLDGVVVQTLARGTRWREVPLVNASFEDGFKDWDKPGDRAEWARDEQIVADGAASARVTMRQAQLANLRSAEFPVTPGRLYRVTAFVRAPVLGFYTVSPQLIVNFRESSTGAPKRTRLAALAPSDRPGWLLMTNDGLVPDDATSARVELLFRDYARALGPTSWVDGVRVWLEE